MKRILISLISVLLIIFTVNAQKQGVVWYFSVDNGLRFNSDGTVEAIKTGATIRTNGGTSIISDAKGCVLFYAVDSFVYNRHNNVMPNGTGIKNAYGGKLIVPYPGSDSLFYLFSVVRYNGMNLDEPKTLSYSIIDMSLDNYNGDVIAGKKNIPILGESMQRFTCIQHSNGKDYWLIAREYRSADFVSFLITENGIKKQVRTTIGSHYPYVDLDTMIYKTQTYGIIKASPDGKRVAMTNHNFNDNPDTMFLFDFDNETGTFSNEIFLIEKEKGLGANFAFEFSPNSQVFYWAYNRYESIVQYDLSSNNQATIQASRYEVQHVTVIITDDDMQLGPDGRIYYFAEEDYIGAINNPNELGAYCNLNREQIYYDPTLIFGFSSFVAGFKYTNGEFDSVTCENDTLPNIPVIKDTVCTISTINAFTPNGDNLNDTFSLVDICGKVSGYSITIYNRWGEQLFESHDINQGWDGTYQGTPVITGVYFYIIKYRETPDGEQQTKAGTVHLIR